MFGKKLFSKRKQKPTNQIQVRKKNQFENIRKQKTRQVFNMFQSRTRGTGSEESEVCLGPNYANKAKIKKA